MIGYEGFNPIQWYRQKDEPHRRFVPTHQQQRNLFNVSEDDSYLYE